MRKAFFAAILFFMLFARVNAQVNISLERNYAAPTYVEQIYKVSSTAAVSIDAKQPEQFKISFEHVTGKLNSAVLNTGEMQTTITQTPVYKTVCSKVEVPDVNLTGHRVYEDKCTQVFDYNQTQKIDAINWSSGFYGKQIRPGVPFYIKIFMPIKAGDIFKADIVPTIAGVTDTKNAWVRADCASKKYITFQNGFQKNNTIKLTASFAGLGLTDLNGLWVVDENLNLTLGDMKQGTIASADGNIFFVADNAGSAVLADINTTYALYYDCTIGAHDVNDYVSSVNQCMFEGEACNFDLDETDISGAAAKFGVNGAVLSGVGDELKKYTGLGALSADANYSFWSSRAVSGGGLGFFLTNAAENKNACASYIYVPAMTVMDNGVETTIGTLALNTYYNYQVHYADNNGYCYWTVRDINGETHFTAKSVVAPGDVMAVARFTFYTYAGTTSYFDNVYTGPPLPAFGLSGELTSNTEPYMASIDLNKGYAKQNDDIKVAANGAGDLENGSVSLLCSTAPNPTIDTNDFCTSFGNASPYADVNCAGKGAAGDGIETIYCRLWDTISYSIDQNIAVYTADNTPPATSFTRNKLVVTFSCADAGAGCYIIYYNLDSTGLVDGNAFIAAYGSHTFSYYGVDGVGNAEAANTGSFTLTGREVDPANISNQNFFDVGKYMGYKLFLGLAMVVGVLIMAFLAAFAFRKALFG
jgi:hypothetical protein